MAMIRARYHQAINKILYVSCLEAQARCMKTPRLLFCAVSLAACQAPTEACVSPDSAQNVKAIHRYFEEVWNQGKLDVLDELLSSDYVNHSSSIPDPEPGPAGVKPIVLAMRQAFPDLRYRIDQLVASDELVAVRVTLSGTHRGDFFGTPPTGKRFEVTQTNLERFREGKIVEHWRNTDELSLLRQLGVVP